MTNNSYTKLFNNGLSFQFFIAKIETKSSVTVDVQYCKILSIISSATKLVLPDVCH